jgi:arginase
MHDNRWVDGQQAGTVALLERDRERERLERSAVAQLAADGIGRLGETLPPAGRVSVHIDLDVLDPAHGRANQYAVPPGISPDDLLDVVRAVSERSELAAVTLSAYDPAFDPGGGVREAALAALRLGRDVV